MHQLFNLHELLINYGYAGISIIVFLESGIFFALPGDSLLFTAGILASAGFLKILIIIPVIFFSTFFGAIFGFYVGENLEKIHRYKFLRKILKDEHIRRAHVFFEKYGRLAVIFSRFVPIVRTFVPVAAGIARMNHRLFVKYSILGSFLWSTVVTLSGYFLGRRFPGIDRFMPILIIVVVLLSLLPVILGLLKKKKKPLPQ